MADKTMNDTFENNFSWMCEDELRKCPSVQKDKLRALTITEIGRYMLCGGDCYKYRAQAVLEACWIAGIFDNREKKMLERFMKKDSEQ